MKVDCSESAKEKGSALIAILWVVGILSIAVFSATQFLFIELESDANSSAIFLAEQLADRGVALAAHPNVKKGDPILRQELNSNEAFYARISSEGERLNLNELLENPEEDRIVLEELFYQWGLQRDIAADVIDNLIDWIDADNEPTNVGAEQSYYLSLERLNHPFNRSFDALDEAMLVKGFPQVAAANPAWKDAFTLLSSGELDLNEAPPELIAAACQCDLEAARLFVVTRSGFDGIQGTLDDQPFEDIDTALQILGIPEGFIEDVADRVSLEDPAQRIISVGRYGGIAVERTVSVQYTGEIGEILQWTTRRIE